MILIANKFEKDVKRISYGISVENNALNITFREFCEKWLDRAKTEKAITYYVNTKKCLDKIYEYIGGYKLKELTPVIIQNTYDKLDTLEKVTYKITAKPKLKKVMQEKQIRYKELRYEYGVNACTLSNMLKGKEIAMKSAETISKILKIPIDKLFNIEEKIERYEFETIHKIKRTVRAILSYAKKQRLIDENYATADYITFHKRPPQKD